MRLLKSSFACLLSCPVWLWSNDDQNHSVLELVENINLIENHVDRRPLDMILKCIKFVKKVCNTELQPLQHKYLKSSALQNPIKWYLINLISIVVDVLDKLYKVNDSTHYCGPKRAHRWPKLDASKTGPALLSSNTDSGPV